MILVDGMYDLLKTKAADVAMDLAQREPGLLEPYHPEREKVAERRAEAYKRLDKSWVEEVAPILTMKEFDKIRREASRRLGHRVSEAVWGRPGAQPHTARGSAAFHIFEHTVCARLR